MKKSKASLTIGQGREALDKSKAMVVDVSM